MALRTKQTATRGLRKVALYDTPLFVISHAMQTSVTSARSVSLEFSASKIMVNLFRCRPKIVRNLMLMQMICIIRICHLKF